MTGHGSSIITKLRVIARRLQAAGDSNVCDRIEAEAENLLPFDDCNDVEAIILREAAAVLNARGYVDIAELVEGVASETAPEDVAPIATAPMSPLACGRRLDDGRECAFDRTPGGDWCERCTATLRGKLAGVVIAEVSRRKNYVALYCSAMSELDAIAKAIGYQSGARDRDVFGAVLKFIRDNAKETAGNEKP